MTQQEIDDMVDALTWAIDMAQEDMRRAYTGHPNVIKEYNRMLACAEAARDTFKEIAPIVLL